MLAGFPGETDRHRTVGEAKSFFTNIYPLQQTLLADYSDQIVAATAGDDAARIKYASTLAGADNGKKNIQGQIAGAEAIDLIGKKSAHEKAFRDWANADTKGELSTLFKSLDATLEEAGQARLHTLRYALLDRAQLLSAARVLYRWAKEREKPDLERERGFQDRDRRLVAERLVRIERRFDPKVDRRLFEAALLQYRLLPESERNAPFEATLAKIGLDRLYAETTLAATPTRAGWLDKSAAEIEASEDPFLQLAVAMYDADMAREAKTKDRDGRLQGERSASLAAYRKYAKSQGRAIFPDANGSLRLTYGHVKGRKRDGQTWSAFTTAAGIVEKHTGKAPFDAPDKELALINARDFGSYKAPSIGALPVDFLSTVDITGGNSGSATLNANGELVGLAFDGTLDGVTSDWWFDPAINRTIHVDARYMRWVMDKVDGADRLLGEMQVAK